MKVLTVVLVVVSCLFLVYGEASAVTLSPNDDVTVRPGRGNLDESGPLGLLVKADGSASFVEFAFGETPVSRATLHLHNYWSNDAVPVDYDVRVRGGAFDFDERTLTHATQPDDSSWTVVINSFHVDNQPRSYALDVTGVYNENLGETVTFSLRSVRGSGDGPIFDDREGTDGHAQGPSIELATTEEPPVIEEVEPDPETVEAGFEYTRQLVLLAGSPPVAWSIIRGPAGLTLSGTGLASGWLPRAEDVGETFEVEVEASNDFGSDRESWSIVVVTPPPNPLVGGGWIAHYYKPPGEVTSLPDFDALNPRGAAVDASIDVPPTQGQFTPRGLDFLDDFAVRYQGKITVPGGLSTFYLTSDGGSRLLVDGKLVVENTAGDFNEASGTTSLSAGEHCIMVEYFEHQGSAGLRVEYAPPGGPRQVIPPSVIRPEPCMSGTVRVPTWRMFEISLTASSRPANPFTVIQLTARVTAPDGRVLAVDGFHDGDGRGGQEGNIWKLRLTPDQSGIWQWATTSNDPFLDGQSGQFECFSSTAPGPVGAAGRYFFRSDGQPLYLLGNFLDRAAQDREEFSHTLLSETITPANRQNMIRRHREFHRANKMNVYLANRGDYGGISTTPWRGSSSSNDKSRFDLERWRMYDEIVAQLRDEGMVCELWFFADDSNFGNLPTSDRQRLIRYSMARLSPYSHTMFVLALEWQEGWSAAEVRTDAGFTQDHNPWDRLVSVHGTTGDFTFPQEAWADFMATQSGNSITPGPNNAHTRTNRNLAAKPLIVEEFGILEAPTDDRLRGNLWAAFCGGAAGSGTGSELSRLRRFIATTGVRFWRMEPDNSLASHGFVLADQGREYVVYVEDGQTFTLQLAPGNYQAAWFNPRGSDGDAGLIPRGQILGGERSFMPPDPNDWVLYVAIPPEVPFVRGDTNSDAGVDLSDALFLLSFLFLGGPRPDCEESADVSGEGAMNISDALYLLNYLFLGGPPPAEPFPDCGLGVTGDSQSCDAYLPCEQ